MKAKWIGCVSDKNYKEIKKTDLFGGFAQYYRKTFALNEKPVKATLKIAALGIFKGFLNGKSVSEELFAPGWTNYNKRILTRRYDVTDLIAKENALSICVGDGWYAGYISVIGRNVYGNYPLAVCAELVLTFSDGNSLSICSDETWKSGNGAIRENDFLCGEVFDDRLPHIETSTYAFDDGQWEKVCLAEDKNSLLCDYEYEPVIMHEVFSATLLNKNGNKYIYDLGQNFAGVVTVKARGKSGSKIIVRHGEMLDGNALYTANLRLAKATDTLILSGREVEYTPTMTYHGFRFIEVTLLDGAELLSIEGRAVYNDLKSTGKVNSSNGLVNKLISNVAWGMKSNFVDLPTDCPQRNERLGWTGDTQVFSRSAMYFADCRRFYGKYLLTLNDDRAGGSIPDIVPYFGIAGFNRSFWRDVAVVLPYNLYEIYGDKETVKKYIPMIKDFLNLQIEESDGYKWKKAFYNDWLNIDENSPEEALATCGNAYCFLLAIKLLSQLGEDCSVYANFLSNVKKTFNKEFTALDGMISGRTQTLYALAYRAELIDAEHARKGLSECLAKRGNHIHSGFCGIRFILPVLCDLELSDLAYELVCKDTFPSWGYSIKNGATTIWERWDSYVEGKGFQSKTMNSFNHYSLGSCGEWFFEYMLGIKPLSAGFNGVIIKPYVDRSGMVNSASGCFDSVNGKISVEWERIKDGFRCAVTKPKSLNADFCFDNIVKIVQDGNVTAKFDKTAERTEIYFY